MPKMEGQQTMLTIFLHIIFVSILTHIKMPNLDILYDDREHHGITKECFLFLFTPISATEQMASCTAYAIRICLFCSITK